MADERDQRYSEQDLKRLRELSKTDAVGAITLSRLFAEIDWQSEMVEIHWQNLVKLSRENTQMKKSGVEVMNKLQKVEHDGTIERFVYGFLALFFMIVSFSLVFYLVEK